MTLNEALISATTLSTTATSVTIAIPSGYTDVRLVMSMRGTSGNTNYDPIGLRVNGSAPNGSYKSVAGSGSGTAGTYGTSNDNFTATTAGGSWMRMASSGIQPGASAANIFSNSEMYIVNYASSSTKNYWFDCINEANTTQAYTEFTGGTIALASPITSISFACRDGSIAAGSTFTLYGVTKLGVTPTLTPKASGGDIIKNDGTYWYHAFLSTGSFIPQTELTADVLVVAGGGGGGSQVGGGGGAGGLQTFTSQSLSATSYACTVGAGGAPGSYINTGPVTNRGSSGTNSQFGALTASVGGGAGGGYNSWTGLTGGSGGGADGASSSGGSGTAGQGYAGGSGTQTPNWSGGGGGGAGGAGGNANGNGGNGGVGATSTFINAIGSATGTGHLVSGNTYFAGGGGGCSQTNSTGTPGTGGYGGGANGTNNDNPTPAAGKINTGGGGGGSRDSISPYNNLPSAGGSGIVIVRYAMA